MAGDGAHGGEEWYQFAFARPEFEGFPVSQDDALTEVGPSDRRGVLEGFDALVLVSRSFFNMAGLPAIAIWRKGEAVEVAVQSRDRKVDERRALGGTDAGRLVSAVLATHADEWTEAFEPDDPVLDGYGWDMTVYSGSRYFMCCGDNAAPRGLVELLRAVADAGLPLAWDGEEIAFARGNERGDFE